jgi:uncharacterized membrane protein
MPDRSRLHLISVMTSLNAPEAIGLEEVNRLRQSGVIGGAAFLTAAVVARDHQFWSLWARRALLVLGTAHLLAGVVYFFAFNWAEMPVWAKFASVESGIVLGVLAAILTGVDRRVGQACLIAASVLTGVLLAVVGQVYQTGADAYQLFAAWALLILPWVMASRSAAHWLLWLVVLYLAFFLFGDQVLVPEGRWSSVELLASLGAFSALVLAAREFAVWRGLAWLAGQWNRLVVILAGFSLLFVPAVEFIFDGIGEPSAFLLLIAGLVGCAIVYRRWLPDFAVLVITIGVTSLVLICAGYRLLDEFVGFEWDLSLSDLSFLGLLIVWCVGVTGAATKLMRGLHSAMAARP